ncbi:MAG: lipid-binding SYLF domain-containing protein [Candidatus Omnitrophota bacterium]|nr:lipid-binding SYLF domain-containing protein [Candidatus Omnitrophota bacterium]
MKKVFFYAAVLVVISVLLVFPNEAFCSNREKLVTKLDSSITVIDEMMQMPEGCIPTQMFSDCTGIAIFPTVLKGGFIWGGRYGQGVILHHDRKTGKWGPPAFFTVGGVSWGLQIGGQAIDLILVFSGEEAVDGLLRGKLSLGADAAVAAGPIGRDAEMSGDVMLKTGIFSYSRTKGLFAGVALKGAIITPNNDSNRIFYGKDVTPRDILLSGKVTPPAEAEKLMNLLGKYSYK